MPTVVLDKTAVHIPSWVQDLGSFRRWLHSEDFPEAGQICFLGGDVWIDLSKEQLFSHNQVKGEFLTVLVGLIKAGQSGHYIASGMMISNEQAELACQPDGSFASEDSWRTGRFGPFPRSDKDPGELEGTLDMVLEVVSTSSVERDTITLRELYWRAGIPEYWLVDARGDRLAFEILRRTAKGYVSTRKQGGWVKSAVFGKSFRLTQRTDELGYPQYTLEVR
jgi:Uma2 family endonuclease